MVFRKISRDIKERIMVLLDEGWIPAETAEIFGVSERSIYRWQSNLEAHGSVVPPRKPLQGRPRVLNADMTHDLSTLISEAPEMYLDEIQDWIALAHDVCISKPALHQNIADCGLTYKMLHKAAAERDEHARNEWRQAMQANWVASQCVVVDETSKDDRTLARLYGRAPSGHRATISANFVRGQRYSMVAAMGVEGYLATRVVEGSVDGEEFFDFIVNEVLPKMNRYPQDNSVLILDNCAIHKSEALREVVEACGVVLEFLPPYSPDFNPIEESFSCVKAWIRRHWLRIQNAEDPFIALYEASGAVTAAKAKEWFRHSGYNV